MIRDERRKLLVNLRSDVFHGDERLHNMHRHSSLHMDAANQIAELESALENLLIAIGMGWDLDGVVKVGRDVLGDYPT